MECHKEWAIREFRPDDTGEVVALWEATGLVRPWNDPLRDIERKLAVQPDLFLVAVSGSSLVGSVMAGYDGHRGWLYYLAVSPGHQGEGVGRELVREAERRLIRLGCPKVQLMVRPENRAVLEFYEGLGYEPSEIALSGERLVVD